MDILSIAVELCKLIIVGSIGFIACAILTSSKINELSNIITEKDDEIYVLIEKLNIERIKNK